ncbi:MAG: hypothetical protein U0744_21165 [Gemmataceae bacterium]
MSRKQQWWLAAVLGMGMLLYSQQSRGLAQQTKKAALEDAKTADVADAILRGLMDRAAGDYSAGDLLNLVDLVVEGARSSRKELAALQDEIAKNPKPLIETAIRVAAERSDVAGFERAAEVAKKLGDKDLLETVDTTRPLLKKVRAASDPVMVALDELSPEAVFSYRDFGKKIEAARLAANKETLSDLEQIVPAAPELLPAMKDALKKKIAAARKDMPEKDAATDMLAKLSKASRNFPPLDPGAGMGQPAVPFPGMQPFPGNAGGVGMPPMGDPMGQMPGAMQAPPPPTNNFPVATVNKDTPFAQPLKPGEWQKIRPGDSVTQETPVSGRFVKSPQGIYFYQAPPPLPVAEPLKLTNVTPNSYTMICAGEPLALVVDGKRIQWGSSAGTLFTTTAKLVTATQYKQVPLLATVASGAKVVYAPGRPAAFLATDKQTIIPFDHIAPLESNRSMMGGKISESEYEKFKKGPTLNVNRWQ